MGKLKRKIADNLTDLNEKIHLTMEELRLVVNNDQMVRFDRIIELSEKIADYSRRMNTLMEFI